MQKKQQRLTVGDASILAKSEALSNLFYGIDVLECPDSPKRDFIEAVYDGIIETQSLMPVVAGDVVMLDLRVSIPEKFVIPLLQELKNVIENRLIKRSHKKIQKDISTKMDAWAWIK